MKKAFNSYRSIPVSDEGSAEKVVIPVAVGLVIGALAVTGANVAKNHIVDTMNDNMGKAIHQQITDERFSAFANDLENSKVTLPVQFYDAENQKTDK